MALYDIISDIAERNITKTETGDNRMYGLVVGIVAKNYDQKMPGRVCVTVPTRDEKANELKWARVVMLSGGSSWGQYFLPEVGDLVVLAFEGGNIEKPYVIGTVLKDDSAMLSKAADANNQFKRIVTRHGNMISFEDNKAGNGEKDKITVETAGSAHTILIDNENKTIRINDKTKENMIELQTKKGEMVIKAKNKLTIQVGTSMKLTMDGKTGALEIKANKITMNAKQEAVIKSGGKMELSAIDLSGRGTSKCSIASSGMMQVSGTPVKIG